MIFLHVELRSKNFKAKLYYSQQFIYALSLRLSVQSSKTTNLLVPGFLAFITQEILRRPYLSKILIASAMAFV